MDSNSYLLIASIGMFVLFVIVLFARYKGIIGSTDYRAIFVLGIIFLPIGYFYDIPVLLILGAVYILLGLVNKDKWGKKQAKDVENSYTY